MYQETNGYVWYACYGSNLSMSRFMEYINSCTDQTPPVEDRPFIFDYPIYFAKSARDWDDGGKAFLDDSSKGMAYGRIYKITEEQYRHVKRKEGPDYTKELFCGEVEGMPVYSFTDTQLNLPQKMPSDRYFSKIMHGLHECYGDILSEREMAEYLIGAIMPAKAFAVACAIKENAHYMTNAEISAATGLALPDVFSAVSLQICFRIHHPHWQD